MKRIESMKKRVKIIYGNKFKKTVKNIGTNKAVFFYFHQFQFLFHFQFIFISVYLSYLEMTAACEVIPPLIVRIPAAH